MRKNIFLKIAGVILLAGTISSCLDTEVDLTGMGDAYILVEMNGQDTLKGLGLHAFSYSEFKSVTVNVTGNASLSYTLSPYLNYKQDFLWSTPLSQYTKTLPATGEYVFNAVFTDDQPLVFYDRLTTDYILPPKIKNCIFNLQGKVAEVEWEKVKLADAYNVKLMDQDGNILFVSQVYNNATTSYVFGADTQGWQTGTSVPADGQKVTVVVSAYLLEGVLDLNEIQCIAKSGSEITWKQ